MNVTRDPVTLQPMVEILGKCLVLKKDVTREEIKQKPMQEVVECDITEEMRA